MRLKDYPGHAPRGYVIARNESDGQIAYWSDTGWTREQQHARIYRTLQAADRTKATRDLGMLYIKERTC